MIARILYLLAVPIVAYLVLVLVAIFAAMVMPAGVMWQAVVTVPVICALVSVILAFLLRRFVVPVETQVRNFKQKTFWGSVVQILLLAILNFASILYGLTTPIEALVLSMILLVIGQGIMLRVWWTV